MYTQFTSTPSLPTTSFKGRTIIVTGSNVGLGLESCRQMVTLGASRIIMAVRNVSKGEAAAKDIRATTSCAPETLEVWQLDLSSYQSVLSFAERVKTELPRLDVLVGNAGIGTETFRITEDNEESITTNLVSLFLLGFLLHPKLRDTALKHSTQTHFTIVGTGLYEVAQFKERKAPNMGLFEALNDEKTAVMSDRYNVSKLLGMYALKQMAAMSPLQNNGVIINCVAPGLCHSQLHRERKLPGPLAAIARPTDVGARVLTYGASAPPQTHGQYLVDHKNQELHGLCSGQVGAKLQKQVWGELRQKLETISPGVTNIS
ncbi:NAD(P)-binding protein [Lophiostoma macrostomum CBS 122681]|uniref:NAD(P)-binding protein n=1 Tax=Lophiostoma macrostomum CBS 122681 TaxID=1314788 RepID=A0A6A6T493_9PLEO|nr:NAD(P)-binding protein [Lophiostoma macrostomum CBS 122681]